MGDVVAVKFGAQTQELESGVDRVKAKIQEIQEPVDALSEKFSAFGELIAGSFALDKVGEFISGVGEAAEKLEQLKTISGLSTDTIQTLQFAMSRTGGDADAAGALMTKFGRAVEEAASGSGPAFEAFQRLHISLNTLKHEDMETVFRKTAEGFKALGSSTEASSIGVALFGRGYASLAGSLHGGDAALDAAHNRMYALGSAMDELRQSSFRGLEGDIKDMNDAWSGLGKTMLDEGVNVMRMMIQAATGLALALQRVVQEIGLAVEGMKLLAGVQTQAQTAANVKELMNAPDQKEAPKNNANRGDPTDADKKQKEYQMQGLEDLNRMYGEDYENYVANEARKVAAGEESKSQELANDMRTMASERDLVEGTLTKELALQKEGTTEYEKLTDEKLLVAEKFNTALTELDSRRLDAVKEENEKEGKVWTDAFSAIGKDYDQLVSNFFTKTETMGQMFQKFAQELVIQFIQSITRIIAENALLVIANQEGWTQMAGALTKSLGEWTMVEGQKTAATAAGNAARTASNTAATAADDLTAKAAAKTSIFQDASESAANVYADVSAIPYVGWILAPPAAAAAFGAVMAFDSFDKGTAYVPHDQVAKIHKGERILTANENSALSEGSLQIGRVGGAGGGNSTVHLHVHALDTAGVGKFMKKNSGALSSALTQAMRGNNTALRSAFAKV